MLGALAKVSVRSWQKQKLRFALTILGVSIGIGAFFAVQTANLTLVTSLQQTVENLAGKATLQVTAGENGFSEEVLETVKSIKGVEIAEPVIEVIGRTEEDANILLVGLDTASDLEIHSRIVSQKNVSVKNPLDFINKDDSIAISRSFAEKNKLKEGDSFVLFIQEGKKEFTIRGFFEPEGSAEIFGGNLAVVDIYTAQEIFGRKGSFDRIDILTTNNVSVEQIQEQLRNALPKGLTVERPSSRGEGLEKSVSMVNLGLLAASFLAITIGVFIIFNCFYISVNQRWREIGVLRALGVESRQIQFLFLGEALVIGLIGSFLGIVIGWLLAIGATRIMSVIAATTYGLVTTTEIPAFRWDYALSALAIGMVSSLFAAWIPAREASKLDPIAALRNIEIRSKNAVIGPPRIITGLVLVAFGLTLTEFATPRLGIGLMFAYWGSVMLGMVLLLPIIISLGARVLKPVMNYFFGIEGVIATNSMANSPKRTSATVGAFMIGLAFVYANGSIIASQKNALVRSLDRAVNADFFVTTSNQIRSRVYHFSEKTSAKVGKIPGVESTGELRVTSVKFKEKEVALLAHEMKVWIDKNPDLLDIGYAERVKEQMSQGDGFFISQNLATLFDVKIGDALKLQTPSGELSREVRGILDYYQSENGTIFLERETYKKFWKDSDLDYILIHLKPETDRSVFKESLEKTLSGEQKAFIYSQEEYRNWVLKLIDQFFTLNYLQMVIAILIAGLGLANTMIISVAERKREIGVIRAIGGLRSQIRKIVLLEAVNISIVGILAGIITGIFNAYCGIKISVLVIAGFNLPFIFPFYLVLISIPVVILLAMIAAWFPARNASRMHVAEAIDYE